MSTRLSASLEETPHPLPLPSSASQPRQGKGAKTQKGNLKRLLPPPPTPLYSHISAAASHPRVGDLAYRGVSTGGAFPHLQASGESFETLKPCWRRCSGLGAWQVLDERPAADSTKGIACTLGAAELWVTLWGCSGGALQRGHASLHCPPLSCAFHCATTQG